MKKNELVEIIAEKCGVSKAKAKDVLECITDTITEKVANGEEVTITGFGTFKRSTRNCSVPDGFGKPNKNSEKIEVNVMTFKSGTGVKKVMNSK